MANYTEFGIIKSRAGLDSYVISFKEWIDCQLPRIRGNYKPVEFDTFKTKGTGDRLSSIDDENKLFFSVDIYIFV
jgi:hypothetical protein